VAGAEAKDVYAGILLIHQGFNTPRVENIAWGLV